MRSSTTMQTNMTNSKKYIYTILSVLVWVGVWWVASLLVGNRFFLPSPLHTIEALFELVGTLRFYNVVLLTLLRVLFGLLIGVLLGIALGILCHRFSPIFRFINLPISVIKAFKRRFTGNSCIGSYGFANCFPKHGGRFFIGIQGSYRGRNPI